MDTERPVSVIPKACANCRIRKIKCTRTFPCSSCEASGIQCQMSSAKAHFRTVPKRRPPAAVDKDEMRTLNQNIEEIRQSIQQLLTLNGQRPTSATPSSLANPEISHEPTSDESPNSVFEGVSSFATQAIDAGEATQMFAKDQTQLAAAQDGLRSLRDIIQTSGVVYTGSGASPKATKRKFSKTAANMQLPPANFVVHLLRTFKEHKSMSLLGFTLGDISLFEKLCKAAYFPTEPVTLGQLAIMHGIIIFLLREFAMAPHLTFPEQYDYNELMALCERNFETAIKTYEVFANPSIENATALRIAATRGQDHNDINACWTYTCCAARQALSLGLHRTASYTSLSTEEANYRLTLFWAIYAHDKSVSLALGQPSTIQDHDVDVDMYPASPDPRFAPWDRANQAFHRQTQIEGRIYDRLYSASAMRKSNEERLVIAKELTQEMEDWWNLYNPKEDPDCYGSLYYKLVYVIPTEVGWWSLICTIHRRTYMTNAGPGTITAECYHAACRSIECHLEAIDQVRNIMNGEMVHFYMSWNLLYGCFTPIIVVFLHVISNFDGRDLELLLQFQHSLADLPNPSEGVVKFRNSCAIFCSVAQAYVAQRDILPNTAPTTAEAIVRREDVQQAFDPSQMTGFVANQAGAADPALDWGPFDTSNLGGMYEFVDGWIDGTQQSVDFFNSTLGTF